MEFIASHWWIWLTVAVLSFLYCLLNQVNRMGRMMRLDNPNAFTKGLYAFVVSGFVSVIFWIISAISIVLNIIEFAKR